LATIKMILHKAPTLKIEDLHGVGGRYLRNLQLANWPRKKPRRISNRFETHQLLNETVFTCVTIGNQNPLKNPLTKKSCPISKGFTVLHICEDGSQSRQMSDTFFSVVSRVQWLSSISCQCVQI
jgi:hypothetical protein